MPIIADNDAVSHRSRVSEKEVTKGKMRLPIGSRVLGIVLGMTPLLCIL